MLLGQTAQYLVDDIFSEFISPALWRIGFLGLVFLGLGLYCAKLLWGSHSDRIREAREENLRLAERTGEIVDEQNILLTNLKKASAIFNADITYRDNRIQKLESEFIRIQRDLNDKIATENHLNGILETRDREVERLSIEVEKLEELRRLVEDKDGELDLLRSEHHAQAEQLKLLELELEDKDQSLVLLEQSLSNAEGIKEKIVSLEELLSNRDNELSRLRSDRDQLRGELENTLRNREARIMELEDSLGDRESMIVALQNELEEAGDLESRIEDFENRIAERELEIEELKSSHISKGELENLREQIRVEKENSEQEVEHLVKQLRQRDSEIQNIKKQYHDARQQKEAKYQEVVNQLESQEGELKSLRGLQSATDKLKARISELEEIEEATDKLKSKNKGLVSRVEELEFELKEVEKSAGSRVSDAEMERLSRENRELFQQLHVREDELALLRKNSHTFDQIQVRIEDLERLVKDRDGELDRLKSERADLRRQLAARSSDSDTTREDLLVRLRDLERSVKDRDSELSSLRVERVSQDDLLGKINELERLLAGERNGSGSGGRGDLYARLSELERSLGGRSHDRGMRAYRSYDNSEYRFSHGDGTATYLKADDPIDFEGKTYRAEDLYYLLRDKGIG